MQPFLERLFLRLLPFTFWSLSFTFSPPMARAGTDKLLVGAPYWTIMNAQGEKESKVAANKALMDYSVGAINTMYYSNTGGASFQLRDFYTAR